MWTARGWRWAPRRQAGAARGLNGFPGGRQQRCGHLPTREAGPVNLCLVGRTGPERDALRKPTSRLSREDGCAREARAKRRAQVPHSLVELQYHQYLHREDRELRVRIDAARGKQAVRASFIMCKKVSTRVRVCNGAATFRTLLNLDVCDGHSTHSSSCA